MQLPFLHYPGKKYHSLDFLFCRLSKVGKANNPKKNVCCKMLHSPAGIHPCNPCPHQDI